MKKREMATLTGVPGFKGTIKAAWVKSVNDAVAHLRRGIHVTASGDRGAINCWILKGVWYCEFQRFMFTKSHIESETMSGVRKWLKNWWPELGRD